VDQSARTITYTPASGFVGHDSFTYTASDGRAGAPAAGTASIDVTAAPPSPGPDPSPNPTPDPTPTPPATCKVPKLIGLHLANAKKRLAKAHCKLGKVKKPKHGRAATLVVTNQSPKAGKRTSKPVTLKLGKAKKAA
jgi:hypothetical protein